MKFYPFVKRVLRSHNLSAELLTKENYKCVQMFMMGLMAGPKGTGWKTSGLQIK